MNWMVEVKQGWNSIEFKFVTAAQAEEFALTAMSAIIPETDKTVSIKITASVLNENEDEE